MPKVDQELAKVVAEIMHDHEVTTVISYDWGRDFLKHCRSCGFFGDKEDPALHTANVVLEYLEGYYKERYGND